MDVRRTPARLGCALLALAVVSPPKPTAAGTPPSFARLAASFIRESEIRDPLFADGVGVHVYDNGLDDYSAAGHARRIAWLRTWRDRIAAAQQKNGLSSDDAADARELADAVELELFEDRTLSPAHDDPSVYTDAVGEAIYALTGRTYATPASRFAHVAPRLAKIPSLIRAAESMLQRPTRVATLQAIDANDGNIQMYASLPEATQNANPQTKAAIAARLPAALASLHDFAHFLRATLLPRSNRNPRVGKTVFDRELSLLDGTDETREDLVASALAAFRSDRAEMLQLAIPFDRRFFPQHVADESKPDAEDVVIKRVLDRLARSHPKRSAVFTAAKGDLERTEAFLEADPVVALPKPSTLSVVPTPPFMIGLYGASFDGPGPFSPLGQAYFYIDTIPKTWSAARVASYLRDFNDYELQMLSIHEAIPGHYVQFRYGTNVPSLVRRVFTNGSYVEGWAVYGEGMIFDAGYRANDPAMRLFQLKWRLREETNALIDAAYHTGDLTQARCEDLLERQAFQERSQALTKWHRIQLSHDQLTTYFVGLDAIRMAQAADRERFGTAYETADFNRRLLALGGVEPRFILPLLAR